MPAPSRRYAVPAAALLLVPLLTLAGCSDGGDGKAEEPTSSPSATGSPTGSDTPSGTDSSSATHGSAAAPAPGGTADKPTVLSTTTRLLDWKQVPGSVDDTVTRSGAWTLTVNQAETEARIEGPGSGSGIRADPRQRISDALIDGDHAVVVLQDKQETRPSSATVVDLRSGDTFTVDGGSDVPTTNGGTWALGEGQLLHATVHQGSYCVASVDLATRKSTLGWCAPARHGFNSAAITPAGESLLTFDDSHPACRTVVKLSGDQVTPFEGVPDCTGWDGLVTQDGAVWSVIPKERQIEAAHAFARTGHGYYDLGPSVSGTLTWCGGAAYFARDPQRDSDPAELMRWTPGDGLEVVYRSHGGHAFLTPPRCGGDTITVTALAQSGDEQVSAALG
ncbi:hypothetical protein [Nocardioides ungokensis]|uniref:hypothetical protein n=1 Tax=Nocardioides ungokensis TaxID=1643322 RepID=UPI0015DF4727|nr:hypothetical protein [Nocardioides ungokensis]